MDDDLKERMEQHREINWSEVTRQEIEEKIDTLEVMDELTSESELTESDVRDISDKINERGRERVDANVVLSTLIADSKTRELIVTLEPDLLTPAFVHDEIENYEELIVEKSGTEPNRVA